jgi:hypothetical protein
MYNTNRYTLYIMKMKPRTGKKCIGAVLRRELHALRDNRAVDDNRLYVYRIPAATGFASGGSGNADRPSVIVVNTPAAPSRLTTPCRTLLPALKANCPCSRRAFL